jgi:hypothetical protein
MCRTMIVSDAGKVSDFSRRLALSGGSLKTLIATL